MPGGNSVDALACASALSDQSLCSPFERIFASLAIQKAPKEDSDQTALTRRLI